MNVSFNPPAAIRFGTESKYQELTDKLLDTIYTGLPKDTPQEELNKAGVEKMVEVQNDIAEFKKKNDREKDKVQNLLITFFNNSDIGLIDLFSYALKESKLALEDQEDIALYSRKILGDKAFAQTGAEESNVEE